uniref:AB hydrolase-1 domain-containing protein n=1 Tax=Oryza meridionalis TaxID=40149 RepID=A0A0E0EE92_9ORYZ
MPSLGIAPLLDAYFRRRFAAAGLVQASVPLDGGATTVQCWRFPPGASEELPVLVLLHGFGPPATWQWRRQVGPLSRRFRLVVPDLLFFGGSGTAAADARSEAHQAEAVAKLVAAVVGAAAAARVSVAGTSYGGFVAYHVARLLGPAAVARVVIASSDLLKADADDRALLRRGGAERVEDVMLPRTPERMRRLLGLAYHRPRRFSFTPAFVLRDLAQYLYTDKIEEKKELIKGITLGDKEKFQLTPLPQEVLVLWGEHDQIFPIEKAFEVARQLGANARLEIIKNTGHMPQEEDPKRFNEALLNFLLPATNSSW